MKKIRVNLNERSYEVIISDRTVSKFGALIRKTITQDGAIIITNPVIAKLYYKDLKKNLEAYAFKVTLLTIPASEKAKSFFYLNKLLNKIAYYAKDRKPFIIALGGGVVGDVSGFVASIYKRGIPYIQIPTTLLAQVDSSIGGKTAIDLTQGKNLAGAFYQPKLVLADISYLRSLPLRQIRAGIAEMIKYALIKDAKFFKHLQGHYKELLNLKTSFLLAAIYNCAKIKSEIVSKDEFEKTGLRTQLNFGHTIGHAIEQRTHYRYNHGEAIALGMVAASGISHNLGLISADVLMGIVRLIKNFGLPTKMKKLNYSRILNTISYDKKFIGKKNRFVLLNNIGKAVVRENIDRRVIVSALKDLSA